MEETKLITEIKALQNEAQKAKREIDDRIARVDQRITELRPVGFIGKEILAVQVEREQERSVHEPFETAQDELHSWADRSVPTGVVMRVKALRQVFPEMDREREMER